MAENTYHVGDKVRMSATFELANVLTDPTTVSLKIIAGEGSWYASPIVNDSVGKYHYDLIFTLPGTFRYRFFGVGAVTAESEKTFKVENV